jgi:hypothetical protein
MTVVSMEEGGSAQRTFSQKSAKPALMTKKATDMLMKAVSFTGASRGLWPAPEWRAVRPLMDASSCPPW